MITGILRNNYGFFIPLLLFVAGGTAWIALSSSEQVHLFINSFHNNILDAIMPPATWIGDGWVIAALCMVALFINYKAAILLIASNLLSSGITQTLKLSVFSESLRPFEYFGNGTGLHLVPGVEMHSYASFPSGHATIAFATCFCLAILSESRIAKFLFFVLALFAGYTRVYLSQHFLNDILAGAVIGTCSAVMANVFIQHWFDKKKPLWINKGLFRK